MSKRIVKGQGNNWLNNQDHIHEIFTWESDTDNTHDRLCMIVHWSGGNHSQVEITRVEDGWYYDDEDFYRNFTTTHNPNGNNGGNRIYKSLEDLLWEFDYNPNLKPHLENLKVVDMDVVKKHYEDMNFTEVM